MPIFPEFHEDDFSVMVDPFNGRVALICPAPIIQFEDVNEYRNWLIYLMDAIPYLTKATNHDHEEEPTIEKNYAAAVIDTWQTQILESLKMSPKKTGTKKSGKKQGNSTNEE